MKSHHPQFKDTAGRLAQLFGSEEGERILRLITQLSPTQNDSVADEPAEPAGKIRVGTWEAVEDAHGRSFVRVETGDPLHLWANVEKIPPKGSRLRIVLLGESVARGYLYDPYFNPVLAASDDELGLRSFGDRSHRSGSHRSNAQ